MLLSGIKITIIGGGKIAFSLASALNENCVKVISVISRSKKSARSLASKFNIPHYSDNISHIPGESNFIILSVPDNQVGITAQKLSLLNLNFSKSYFIHLSGVETIAALKPLQDKKGNIASVHIMQTFPSKKTIDIKGCHAAIESKNTASEKFIFSFAKRLKLQPFRIDSKNKTLYHLAGVYASNFLTGNFYSAEKLFSKVSPQKDFYAVIEPIIRTTLSNIKNNGPVNSLSGPVERGDIETIINHLKSFDLLLEKKKDKKDIMMMKKNYILQSLNLIDLMIERNGSLKENHKKIKDFLLNELNC